MGGCFGQDGQGGPCEDRTHPQQNGGFVRSDSTGKPPSIMLLRLTGSIGELLVIILVRNSSMSTSVSYSHAGFYEVIKD